MTVLNKQAYRADGGDIGIGRLKEIADNAYGDEEKRWLAQRVLALLDKLEAKEEQRANWYRIAEALGDSLDTAEKRIAELETRSISLTMPPRKTLDDYINDEFDPSDLAAIYNACRLECEVKFKNACHAAGIAIKEV
jgi:hypothetical protein